MNPDVQRKFESYPLDAQQALAALRQLILSVAQAYQLGEVEESLKWGEASYWVNGGSAVRIDWKAKEPAVIKVFFHCQTRLITTFREIYHDELVFEDKRAIVISLTAPREWTALRHCIVLALQYHRVKHLPLLGA